MIQTTASMRILVAIEPVDFRRGIDGWQPFAGSNSNRIR